jgi:hypothetical protein
MVVVAIVAVVVIVVVVIVAIVDVFGVVLFLLSSLSLISEVVEGLYCAPDEFVFTLNSVLSGSVYAGHSPRLASRWPLRLSTCLGR